MKTLSFLPLTATLASAVHLKGYLTEKNIPYSGKDWVTLDNGVEFQAGDDVDPRLEHARRLWGTSSKMDNPVYVDGTETYYDDYAQAWRLLGLYVDCHHCQNGGSEAACAQQGQEPVCQRYLLWAAYVDLEYSGNGAGEYAYYDRHKKTWNHDACKESGSERCVKMDCHEPSSHFKLLGIFKEPDYSTFMQQVFTYQGNCIWTDEEYSTMTSAMNVLPQGCTQASNGLYYDMKPDTGGSMTIGLYTDNMCIEEYTGSRTVGQTVSAMVNDDDGTQQVALGLDSASADSWNKAFDAFKICQPCKATDLVSIINHGAVVERYENMNDDGTFRCGASANEAEINQCMQFRGNTNMYVAKYSDVVAAQEQGTVASVKIGRVKYGESELEHNGKWKRNFISALFMIASFFVMVASFNRCQNEMDNSGMNRPLMDDENESSTASRGRRRG